MSAGMSNVYVSYAWGGQSEKTVDEIEAALKARGIPFVRDKAELGYRGRIREFMEEIGRGHAVVVVLSDKYLRSPNCMLELVEIMKNGDMHERIFPVVLGDADIYDMARRLQYKKHWRDKLDELSAAAAQVGLANLHNAPAQASQYDRFGDHVMELAELFGNMNSLTPAMHASSGYRELVTALEAWLQQASRRTAAATPVPSTTAAQAHTPPAAAGPRIAGLGPALAKLLNPEETAVTAVQVLALDEEDQETLLLVLWLDGDMIRLDLGEDFSALDLPPEGLARLASAAHSRGLGSRGKLTADHLRAAAVGVVDNLFGLPTDRYVLRAVVAVPDDEEVAGVQALSAHLDHLLCDETDEGAVSMVMIWAIDEDTGNEFDLLWVLRAEDDTLMLLAGTPESPADGPPVELPEDLVFTRAKRKQLRELGFADAPDRGAGDGMTLDLGARTEIDPEALVETLAATLAVVVGGEEGVYRLESRLDSDEMG